MAAEGYKSYQDQSFGKQATQTINDIPVVGNLAKAGESIASGDINIGSIGSDVANFAMGATSILEDPLQSLISAGLGFLMDVISPLKTALETVTGDPGALEEANKSFTEIGKEVSKLASDLTDITTQGFANWSGDAKDAAAKQVNDFVNQVDETANVAGNISMCLQLSGTLMDAAYNLVLGIISQCIEWLIVTWIAAQAAAVFTLGASEAAATAATAGEVAVEGANAADKVEQATTLVEKIVNIIKQLWSKIKNMIKYVKDMKDAQKAEKAAKEAETAAKDGTKVASEADKAASSADKAAGDAGKANGDKPGGDNSSNASSDGNSNTQNQNWAQQKMGQAKQSLGEAKQQLHDDFRPTVNNKTGLVDGTSTFGEAMRDGVKDVAKDVGKETLSNAAGNIVNGMQYSAQTAPPTPEQDGQQQEDPTMSGSLYD